MKTPHPHSSLGRQPCFCPGGRLCRSEEGFSLRGLNLMWRSHWVWLPRYWRKYIRVLTDNMFSSLASMGSIFSSSLFVFLSSQITVVFLFFMLWVHRHIKGVIFALIFLFNIYALIKCLTTSSGIKSYHFWLCSSIRSVIQTFVYVCLSVLGRKTPVNIFIQQV